jgi:hypothetical protein
MLGGGRTTGLTVEMRFMAEDSTISTVDSFVQARRRALTLLRSGMELCWSPAGSRHELHRNFRDGSVDPVGSRRPLDPTGLERSIRDERE